MKVRTERFDLKGMGTGRLLRRLIVGKLTPYWSCSGDLRIRELAMLATRQWLGLPLAWLTLRYERHWIRLLSYWRRLRALAQSRSPRETATDDQRS